jgi:hypothetical protein
MLPLSFDMQPLAIKRKRAYLNRARFSTRDGRLLVRKSLPALPVRLDSPTVCGADFTSLAQAITVHRALGSSTSPTTQGICSSCQLNSLTIHFVTFHCLVAIFEHLRQGIVPLASFSNLFTNARLVPPNHPDKPSSHLPAKLLGSIHQKHFLSIRLTLARTFIPSHTNAYSSTVY